MPDVLALTNAALPAHPRPPTGASVLRGARVVVVNWRDLDHSLAGGSEHYAWHAATALRDAGADVEFVTARERGQARDAVRDGIRVRRGGGPFTFYAHAAARLLRLRGRIDLVVDPDCGIPTFTPLFVRRSTPVVLVLHHVHREQFATYFPAPLARLGQWLEGVAMPRVYRNATAVAVSESTRHEVREQFGWTGPIQVLVNGADLPTSDEIDTQVVPTAPRLLALGRIVLHKRVDLVVRALDALTAERPDLTLDICGDGPDRARVAAVVDELGLGDRVRLHGFLDESAKRDLLRVSSLHVCASDAEGWGQVVIESAAFGLPTVARDVPGLRDSVRAGRTGWLVPQPATPTDEQIVAGLAGQIRSALDELDDPARAAELRTACRAWAAGFSWETMHDRVRDLAAGLLAGACPDIPQAPRATPDISVVPSRVSPSGATRSER